MERSDVVDAVSEMAADILAAPADSITETSRFREDLDADSLDLVELVMAIEERFDVEVGEAELEHVSTVGQAVDLVLAAHT